MYSRSLLSRTKSMSMFLNDVRYAVRSELSSIDTEAKALQQNVANGDANTILADFVELRRTIDFCSKSRKRSQDAPLVQELRALLEEFDYIEARWGALTQFKFPLEDAVTKLWKTLDDEIEPPRNYHFNSQIDVIFSEMRRELSVIWGARSTAEISIARFVEIIDEFDELVAAYGDDEHKAALESFRKDFDHIEAQLMVLELVDA